MDLARGVAIAALLALPLTGCSFGADNVPQDDLEERVADSITLDDPDAELNVECEGELEAEEGATQVCSADDGSEGGRTGLRLEVTEVDGDSVEWDHTVFVHGSDLQDIVGGQLEAQAYDFDEISCPDDLDGEFGEKVECDLEGAQAPAVAVVVTEVDGLRINTNFQTVS